MEIKEFTENLVKSVVKESDMVKVTSFNDEDDTIILEVLVHNTDMGAVIGKNGKMAKAIRTIIQAHAYILGLGKVKINIDSF